jgi:hypothetical protein
MDEQGMEPMAKYVTETDKTAEEVKNLCRDLVAGAHACPDAYDFFNAKFIALDKNLADAGFTRAPLVDPENMDARCTFTYDAVVNVDDRSVKVLTFKMTPCAEEPGYAKKYEGQYVLGKIVQ